MDFRYYNENSVCILIALPAYILDVYKKRICCRYVENLLCIYVEYIHCVCSSGFMGPRGPWPTLAPIFHLSRMKICTKHRVMTKNFAPWPPISILDPLLCMLSIYIAYIKWIPYTRCKMPTRDSWCLVAS